MLQWRHLVFIACHYVKVQELIIPLQYIIKLLQIKCILKGIVEGRSFWFFKQKNQKELIIKYGNDITLLSWMTYIARPRWISLCFLDCEDSSGTGMVVATIIPQHENEDMIAEGLTIIETMESHRWLPEYSMTDKSDTELNAIGKVFPSTTYSSGMLTLELVHPKKWFIVWDSEAHFEMELKFVALVTVKAWGEHSSLAWQ